MQRNVSDELNREFGNDVKNLSKAKAYHAALLVKKQEIEQKLKISKGGDPAQLKGVLGFARDSLEKMQLLEGVHGKILNDVSAHLDNASLVKKEFESSLADIQKLLRLKQYLQWIAKIEETRQAVPSFVLGWKGHIEFIEEAVNQGQDDQAVSHVAFLLRVWGRLQASACSHLVAFLRETILYWHLVLREKFEKEFEKVLQNMGWPILNTGAPSRKWGRRRLLLPLELMLRPLKKRFLFHFTGKRQTNRLDKPEWYLSQILTWVSDHGEFCDRFVQAVLVKAGVEGVQARLELMRGLVQIGIHKFQMDLPSLLSDDHLLTHAIEEVLLFDRELRAQGYPPFYPCILNVLTADHCFIRWIALEKKYADEKRDRLLTSPTAWKPQYQTEGDLDDMKIPECAEAFMMVLSAMTERYRHLELAVHRLKFVSLQQILLEDWRLCLQQILTARLEELDMVALCPIINAAHYVVQVLAQWSVQPAKEKLRRQATKHINDTVDPEEALFLAASETPSDDSFPLPEYSTLQESVFEESAQLLEKLYTDTVLAIVDELVLDFKAKSKAYRREKWFCMPALNEREDAGLTPTAFPMLSRLRSNLQHLQEALAVPLFNSLWQEAARGLSLFLYEERLQTVVCHFWYGETGVFGVPSRPYIKSSPEVATSDVAEAGAPCCRTSRSWRVKEACILLTMPHPVAWILQETLRAARQTDVVTGGTALEEQGVSFLTPSQAMHVLSKRNDLVHT
ncbi:hypothetical protein HPB47_023446 [Ixodes persulcatus]|uniref:Uncharacterized protein n=1 Tax=Ixodes persulcatus TaxID=34615 RepID=A0AC60Q995_IXOPE|nr:hypothetical protein HPB47_023446 [Ixodes persulcatus]